MKTFLISATIFVFVLILIIVFQNIANTLSGIWILFTQLDNQTSASLGIIAISAVGFIAGVLSTLLAFTIINESKIDETNGAANW